MPYDQIARTLRQEILQEMPRIQQLLEVAFHRQVYRQKKRHVLKLMSRRKLEITLYIRNAYKRHFILGAWYLGEGGYCYAHMEDRWITLYPTHLFERFSERYLQGENQDVKCIGRQFFFEKHGTEYEELKESTLLTDISVIKQTLGGVIFGKKNLRQELTVMHTYIDYGSLSQKKKKMVRDHEMCQPMLHLIRAFFPEVLARLYRRGLR